jgi:hypothetical protein
MPKKEPKKCSSSDSDTDAESAETTKETTTEVTEETSDDHQAPLKFNKPQHRFIEGSLSLDGLEPYDGNEKIHRFWMKRMRLIEYIPDEYQKISACMFVCQRKAFSEEPYYVSATFARRPWDAPEKTKFIDRNAIRRIRQARSTVMSNISKKFYGDGNVWSKVLGVFILGFTDGTIALTFVHLEGDPEDYSKFDFDDYI